MFSYVKKTRLGESSSLPHFYFLVILTKWAVVAFTRQIFDQLVISYNKNASCPQ